MSKKKKPQVNFNDALRQLVSEYLTEYKNSVRNLFCPTIERNFLTLHNTLVIRLMDKAHANGVESPCPDKTSLLPEGTKYIFRQSTDCLIVIEQKPQVRTISIDATTDVRGLGISRSEWEPLLKPKRYRLAFPYMLFVLTLSKSYPPSSTTHKYVFKHMKVVYANASVNNLQDKIYPVNLPNISANGDYCRGMYKKDPLPFCDAVNDTIGQFWSSIFALEWAEDFHRMANRGLTLENWANKTKEDPFFVLSTDWGKSRTLGDAIGTEAIRSTREANILHAACSADINATIRNVWNEIKPEFVVGNEDLEKELLANIEKACGV